MIASAMIDLALRRCPALVFFAWVLCHLAVAASADERWEQMDYGPFITTSVECESKKNIAYKGIAMPLRDEESGAELSVVFDTDLLRYAAGWKSGFLKLKGIVFDGVHGTFPAMDGDLQWSTQNAPGWADRNASFDDPRPVTYGPLPTEHARWIGLHDTRGGVVLEYSVGDVTVRDRPGVMMIGDQVTFTRTVQVPAADRSLYTMVASHDERRMFGVNTDGRLFEVTDNRCHVAILANDVSCEDAVAVALVGDPGGAFLVEQDHGITLCVPDRSERPAEVEVTIAVAAIDGEDEARSFFVEAREALPPHEPLTDAVRPARRWREVVITSGRLDIESRAAVRTAKVEASDRPRVVTVGRLSGESELVTEGRDASDSVIVIKQPLDRPEIDPAAMRRGLVGYWPLDEGSGFESLPDDPDGPRIMFEGATWRRGIRDRCVEFNGTNSARIEALDAFEFLDSPFTLACWVNTENAHGTIFSHTLPDSKWVPDGKTLFLRGGRVCFDIGWVGVIETPGPVNDERWHHVALTWSPESETFAILIDGEEAASRAMPPKGRTDGHIARLGYTSPNFPGPDSHLFGKIDDLRIWKRALSDEEVLSLAMIEERSPVRAFAATGAPKGSEWRTSAQRVALHVPATDQDQTIEWLVWDGFSDGLPEFEAIVADRRAGRGAPFIIDEITSPRDNPWHAWMRYGGFDFFENVPGRAAICTWSGDVWLVDGLDQSLDELRWQRIATGLYQPLGLKVVDDAILVAARDQITVLRDLNGDGETDFYENFNNDTFNSEHFHEPCMDLHTDAAGNVYYMKAARHALRALHPHHGTLVKVAPDGSQSEVVANGFRAANGFGIGPVEIILTSDQEGYWMPANKIAVVRPGKFHGNAWGWLGLGETEPPESYEPPLCWLHPSVDRSPSGQLWIPRGVFGLAEGGWIGMSYGTGDLYRILYEEIGGVIQGGIVPLGVRLPTGAMRARINPHDGHLYVCGLVGWSSDRTVDGGFYRVRRTNRPLHVPARLRVLPDGIEIEFPHELDRAAATDPSNYSVQAWNYKWSAAYGSPEFRFDGSQGRERMEISRVELGPDQRTVRIIMPRIQPVMQMHVTYDIRAASGGVISSFVHQTIHRVPRE